MLYHHSHHSKSIFFEMPFLTMHSLTRVPFMRYDGIKFGVLIQPPRGCGWREAVDVRY